MSQANCISRDQLQDFSLGYLGDQESNYIESHLLECKSCEETLASLEGATDSILRHLQQPAKQAPAEISDTFRAAMKQVNNLRLRTAQQDSNFQRKELGDYELENVIGFGGMGTVYRAIHRRLQMPVAVKLLPERRLGDPAAIARFQREMQAIGQLDHPAIVRATDAGEFNGTHFLVMELVDGVDLSRLIRAHRTITVANACEIIRQAAQGIAYAHKVGVIHRDIKPSNLMLNRLGKIKILDLGLARLGGLSHPVDELTTVGQLMGTLDYMAPEQCDDTRDITPAADIYALGATLYKLLTGAAPYSGAQYRTLVQKLRAVGIAPIERLDTRCTNLPSGLADLVHQTLAADPDERFSDAGEFAAKISKFCDGHDLSQLCANALEVCEEDSALDFLKHESTGLGASVQSRSAAYQASVSDQSSASAQRFGKNNRWKTVLMAIGAAALFLFAMGVIYIETGKGTLVIESAKNVEVTIRKSDKIHQRLQLKQGENSTRIGAGSYTIEIVGASDSLEIENDQFVIKRGGNWLAKIRENESVVTSMAKDKQTTTGPYTLGHGDVLGIFIEGVLGEFGANPPVHIPSTESGITPFTGFPFQIGEDEILRLPLIDPIDVRGKTVAQVRHLITDAYKVNVSKDGHPILREDATIIVSLVRKRTQATTVSPPSEPQPLAIPAAGKNQSQ